MRTLTLMLWVILPALGLTITLVHVWSAVLHGSPLSALDGAMVTVGCLLLPLQWLGSWLKY